MFQSHRHGDSRTCGATTVVVGNSTVFSNSKLWAVLGDPNTDGAGGLINTAGHTVLIEGKFVIVNKPDHAVPDDKCPLGSAHCDPFTTGGSPDVFAY